MPHVSSLLEQAPRQVSANRRAGGRARRASPRSSRGGCGAHSRRVSRPSIVRGPAAAGGSASRSAPGDQVLRRAAGRRGPTKARAAGLADLDRVNARLRAGHCRPCCAPLGPGIGPFQDSRMAEAYHPAAIPAITCFPLSGDLLIGKQAKTGIS